METEDYCQLLGVSRFASKETLRRAFRARLFANHPDRNPGDALASERTRELVEAYRTLLGFANPPQPRTDFVELRFASAYAQTGGHSMRSECVSIAAGPGSRLLVGLAVLAFMVFVVLAVTQAVLGERGVVYRPDLSKMPYTIEDSQASPASRSPATGSAVWFHAQEYSVCETGTSWADAVSRSPLLTSHSAWAPPSGR